MDMTFNATPMVAQAVLRAGYYVYNAPEIKVTVLETEWVAYLACPSIGGTSLSAVAPDLILERSTALAAA